MNIKQALKKKNKLVGMISEEFNKAPLIMQVNLITGDGLVLQTFKPNHYSWWRTNNYNVPSTPII